VTGAFEKAVVPLRRAKALDANDPRTRFQLGYALLMLRRPQEAEQEYVSSKMPGVEGTLFALFNLYSGGRESGESGGGVREAPECASRLAILSTYC
jgi:hypothetical protein